MAPAGHGHLAALNATAAYQHITPLHFLPHPQRGPGGRRRGRRMSTSISGWQMEGNLHTLGYFSATVCVGSPPRKFDLIIDTGSALTALPCESCPHCGTHNHGSTAGARFSEKASSTSSAVSCSQPPKGMSGCRQCAI
jgi:hypothetical protein